MKVGTLTGSVSRQAGGLFESVRAITKATAAVPGVSVEVFGLRDRYTDADLGQWDPLKVSVIERLGTQRFGFAPKLPLSLSRADVEVLHVHGIWMYPSLVSLRWARAFGKPYVISPHGMLDAWAVNHSRWKKLFAHLAYEGAHLHGAACLRALCASEAEAMRAYGLRNPIAVIPNGVSLPEMTQPPNLPTWTNRVPKDAKVLLFLGRVHPKKGLANLLRAWGRVSKQRMTRSAGWHLVIAGWEQGGHQAKLEQLVESLGIQPFVHFVGPQFDADKATSYRHATAFVLPSLSEGLPMSVLEAWSYSLPVLMTPQCNLQLGVDSGCALNCEPEVDSLASGLELLCEVGDGELRLMGERGRQLVEQHFQWLKIGAEMVDVYNWLLARGPRPDCVRTD